MKAYLKEMLKRKDLLFYLVKAGLKAEHRNSYLGYFWWLLDPLLNVLVYYFLVVIILGRGGENYPVYLVIGLVVWRWINTSVTASAKSITRYSGIISQVYLPKSLFPIAFTLTQLFNFVFGLAVIAIFLVVNGTIPGWQIVYLPIIVLIQLIFLFALSLFLAYITVFVRDINNVLNHVMRIFFYASPIIWEGDRLPEQFYWLTHGNPVAIIVTAYRDILMYRQIPDMTGLLVILGISVITIVLMLNHYRKNEHKIIKAL